MILRASIERTKHTRMFGTNISPEELALRESLFEQIKALNDTRIQRPVLI
jgi:hypothetical protein